MTASVSGGRNRLHSLAQIAPLVALWLIAVVAVIVLLPFAQRVEDKSTRASTPEWINVGSRADPHRLVVDVHLTYAEPEELRAPVAGMVTKVYGGTIATNGRPLIDLDGVPRMIITGDTPPYRDVFPGDQGSDIVTIAEFLSELGLLESEDVGDNYSPAIQRAVCRLRGEYLGIAGTCDRGFRREWVVYVSDSVSELRSVGLRLGDVVETGAVIASTVPELVGLEFTPSSDTQSMEALAGESVVLTAPSGAQMFSLAFPEFELVEVEGFLRLNGQETSRDTSELNAVFTGFIVELAEPSPIGVVPSVALYVADSGVICLFGDGDSGWDAIPTPVYSVRGELGSVGVDSSLIGLSVVRDPSLLERTVLDLCGS